MADIEARRPIQKDTIFQIMSMTKPVTAIGIMMLAEEGKIALRDPVEQYLPPRLVEVGTHDELMAKCGQYSELYGIQAAAYR
jgi:CubicO group peptidase (beta-lactamase class C family)